MIRRMLELEGYQIVVLRSDEDALEVFGDGTPQALLAKESFLLCHTEAQIVTSLHDIAECDTKHYTPGIFILNGMVWDVL